MSEDKEFEALKFIFGEALFSEYRNETHSKVRECNDLVFNALTELKQIKEANPSKVIDSLEFICKILKEKSIVDIKWLFKHDYNAISQTLLKAQELEKVLNGIIKHLSFEDSGIEVVKDFINDKEETKYIIKVISKDTGATIHIHLDTKEEVDLLKRWSEK